MSFDPKSIAGLWGWWRADLGVTEGGGTMSAWADQSGNGRNMTVSNGTPGYDPAGINGLPAIVTLFNGDSGGVQALGTGTNHVGPITEATVWIVAKQLAGDSAFGAFLNAGNNLSLNRFNTSNRVTADSATGSIVIGAQQDIADDTWYTFRLRVTTDTVYLSVNGGAEVSAPRDPNTIGTLVAQPLFLFTDTGNHYGRKAIAEVVFYTANLTGNNSLENDYRLQQKYNHYAWTGPLPESETGTTPPPVEPPPPTTTTAPVGAAGLFFIDGMDLYLNFGVIIELGEAEALKYPPLKEPQKHDWLDSHGVEVDLTTPRYNERNISLHCALLATTEAAFLQRKDRFIAQLMKPGLHRLEFKTHPGRQYFVYYKSTDAWTQNIPLKGTSFEGLIGQKFTLTLNEPDPSKSFTAITAIADDEGRVIIM